MKKIFGFPQNLANGIQRMYRSWSGSQGSPGLFTFPGNAVGVWVMQATSTITARSSTTPGSGTAKICYRSSSTITVHSPGGSNVTATVYNLTTGTLATNDYFFGVRDLAGSIWVFQSLENTNYKQIVRFTLAADLATTDSSKTATISLQIGPGIASPNTGAGAITVFNMPIEAGNYMFSGDTGNYGYAAWDSGANYYILQMECP